MLRHTLLSWVLLAATASALTPSSYLSSGDRARLKTVFEAALAGDDAASMSAGVVGLGLLGEAVPKGQDICNKLKPKLGASLSETYQAAVAGETLKCQFKPAADVTKVTYFL